MNSIRIGNRSRRGIAILMSFALAISMFTTGNVSSSKQRNRLYMVVDSGIKTVSSGKGMSVKHEALSDNMDTIVKGKMIDVSTDMQTGVTVSKRSLFTSGGGSQFVTGVAAAPIANTGMTYDKINYDLLKNKGETNDGGIMVFSIDYVPSTGRGTWSDVIPKAMDAKNYYVYYGSSKSGASSAPQYIGGPIEVTIKKAEWTKLKCSYESTYGITVNLGFSDNLAPGGVLGNPTIVSDPDKILVDGSVETTEKTLKYKIVKDSSKKGKSALVRIPVTGCDNYTDYNLDVTLKINSKDVPTVTANDIKKTYNNVAVKKSDIKGTAKFGNTTVKGSWDFVNAGEMIDVSDSGKKTVRFTPDDSDTYSTVDAVIAVSISYKAVTVTADNKSKAVGAVDPKLTATVSGLLSKDTVDYDISRTSGESAGTYTIKVEGEKYQGNYSVTYKNGTLRIGTSPTATPKPTSTPSALSTPRASSTPYASERPTSSPKRTTSPDEPLVKTYTNKSGEDVTTVTKVDESGNQIITKTVVNSKTGEIVSTTVSWVAIDRATGEILTETKTVKSNGKVLFTIEAEKENGDKVTSKYVLKNAKNNTVIATGASLKGKVGTLVIPNTIVIRGVGYIVTGISKDAFRSNSSLEKIVIKDYLTDIGDQAFCKSGVVSVNIGKGVKTIGEQAFLDAQKLKEIHLKCDKLKSVGKDAFKGTAEGLTIYIYADKKTYKQIVKMVMDSGKLPKKVKFNRKKK